MSLVISKNDLGTRKRGSNSSNFDENRHVPTRFPMNLTLTLTLTPTLTLTLNLNLTPTLTLTLTLTLNLTLDSNVFN